MKIYDEVTIDMNPESSTYGKHLSESSSEYNGNIDLCKGSGADQWTVKDDEYSAGYMAAGMEGGTYPRQLKQIHGGGLDPEIFSGEYKYGGAAIDSDLGTVDPEKISRRSGWQRKWETGFMGGHKWQGQEEETQAQQVARDFQSKWYDPYKEVALTRPFEALAVRGLEEATAESTGLSQEQIDRMQGVTGGSQYGLTEGGKYMAKGSGTEMKRLTEEFDITKQTREDELATLEEAEELAAREKGEKLKKIGSARSRATEGVLPAEEALRAEAAGTGFSYSAPGQRQAMATRGQAQQGLEDLTDQERLARESFALEEERIEGQRGEVEEAFEAAEAKYGADIANVLATGKGRVNELIGAAGQILEAHQGYGKELVEQSRNVGGSYGAGDWGNWEYADITRNRGGVLGSPTGGYFQEDPGGTGFTDIDTFLRGNVEALSTSAQRLEGDLLGEGGE
jgi:hypothetical protein